MRHTYIIFFITLAFITRNSYANIDDKPVFTGEEKKKIFTYYEKFFDEYVKHVCTRDTEKQYWQLVRNYQGKGIYVPMLPEDGLDVQTIQKNLPVLGQKIKWIETVISKLKKEKNFSHLEKNLVETENSINEAVNYKRLFFEENDIAKKNKLRMESRRIYSKLRQEVLRLFSKLYFYQSYNFPVDHFNLRAQYDQFKKRKDIVGKRKANEIYFTRKIFEDGAQNPEGGRNDMYLRSVFNMLAKRIQKQEDFIPEDIRYDLMFILSAMKENLKRGPQYQIPRLEEWLKRENEEFEFYQLLLADKVKEKEGIISGRDFVKNRFLAMQELRQFVQKKQKEVYLFWREKREIYRALFSIDTILFNEVGGLDGREALERKDVANVVINRSKIKFYSTLSSDDDLFPILKDIPDLQEFKWLNTLFKEGEFSFTYFFIPSTIRVFCPDMTKYGKFLREENLELAFNLLTQNKRNFSALRYYSRTSMTGRINMEALWEGFQPYPERPGPELKNVESTLKKISENKYQFLYYFIDPEGAIFKVLNSDDKLYVADIEGKHLYEYRNPHYFRFFIQK